MPQTEQERNAQNRSIDAALRSLGEANAQQPRGGLPNSDPVPAANRQTQNAVEPIADRLTGAKKK